jgi:hypothetical protein
MKTKRTSLTPVLKIMAAIRQKILFHGKSLHPVYCCCIMVGAFSLTSPFPETVKDHKLIFLGNKNVAPIVYLDQNAPAVEDNAGKLSSVAHNPYPARPNGG